MLYDIVLPTLVHFSPVDQMSKSSLIFGFLKRGYPQIIHFYRISIINHPFWGSTICGNPPFISYVIHVGPTGPTSHGGPGGTGYPGVNNQVAPRLGAVGPPGDGNSGTAPGHQATISVLVNAIMMIIRIYIYIYIYIYIWWGAECICIYYILYIIYYILYIIMLLL